MLNITALQHEGKENRNYEIPSHIHEDGCYKFFFFSLTESKSWQGYGETGTPGHYWGDAEWCSHGGRQYGRPSKNQK